MILDLCGVMTHFSEGNCVLRSFFWDLVKILDLSVVAIQIFEEICVVRTFLGSRYDLGPMWGDDTLLQRELCFEAFFVISLA